MLSVTHLIEIGRTRPIMMVTPHYDGSAPAADSVGCKAGRRTCSELEIGTEKLCEIKWYYHIVGTRA
jgi:hypothetical protein